MTTTPAAIATRIVALVEALTPTTETSIRYTEHRSEDGQSLDDFAEVHPEACMRRFEVRYSGDRDQPEVSNTDVEAEERDFDVVVAYPTSRWSTARERDAVIDADANQVNHEVGTNSYGSITDCTMLTEGISREDGSPATFAVINLSAHFYRSQL
jgi:hypothetical protein